MSSPGFEGLEALLVAGREEDRPPPGPGGPAQRLEAAARRLELDLLVAIPAPGEESESLDYLAQQYPRVLAVDCVDETLGEADRRGLEGPRPGAAAAAPAAGLLLQEQRGGARAWGPPSAFPRWLMAGVGPSRSRAGLLGRIALALGLELLDVVLLITSWWLLGSLAFGVATEPAWVAGWAGLALMRVACGGAAGWVRLLALQGAAEHWRRRVFDGLLAGVEERSAGEVVGGLAEIDTIEEAAHDGTVAGLTGGFELVAVVTLLGVALSTPLLAALLVALGVLTVAGWAYARATELWSRARVCATAEMLARLDDLERSSVIGASRAERRREERVLEQLLAAGRRVDRWSWMLAIVPPRLGLMVGIALLVFEAGQSLDHTRLAVSLGALLLLSSACSRLGEAIASLAVARAAFRRLEAIGGLAAANAGDRRMPDALVEPPTAHDLVLEVGSRQVPNSDLVRLDRHSRLVIEAGSESVAAEVLTAAAGRTRGESTARMTLGGLPATLWGQWWSTLVVGAPRPEERGLLAGSLAWNLLLGRCWPPRGRDLEAAEQLVIALGLEELLAGDGLAMRVGSGGRRLSEGEIARVLLARALLREPAILVAAEPLAPLDPALRARVGEVLMQQPRGIALLTVEAGGPASA